MSDAREAYTTTVTMADKGSSEDQQFPHFGTLAIHAGQEPEQWRSKAVVPPISLSTTFKQDEPGKPVGTKNFLLYPESEQSYGSPRAIQCVQGHEGHECSGTSHNVWVWPSAHRSWKKSERESSPCPCSMQTPYSCLCTNRSKLVRLYNPPSLGLTDQRLATETKLFPCMANFTQCLDSAEEAALLMYS